MVFVEISLVEMNVDIERITFEKDTVRCHSISLTCSLLIGDKQVCVLGRLVINNYEQ